MSPNFGSKASRWSLLIAAAVGMGLSSGLARAADNVLAPSPILMDDEAPAPKPLLTQGLEAIGAGKFLSDTGITVGGYVQGSWTYNASDPNSATNAERGFDFENQDLTFNGVSLFVARDIKATPDKFDIGFHLEALYGADARFTHSNGLFDDNQHGDVQYDLTQAYVEVAVPVGRGLLLNIGKFITPIGYEYVDPTKNTLFSHGYLFNFGAPYSHTGVTGTYSVSDELTVMAGLARGWDQSTDDNNGAIEFLGSATWAPEHSQWTHTLTLSVGPQSADNYGYRTELDALCTYKFTDKWSFGGEAMYGIQADVPGTNDDYSQWYGLAVYPSYDLCSHASLNGRLEWFSDVDGTRGVGATNAFEVTLGVSFFPLAGVNPVDKAFKIRPEIRFDYADDRVFNGDYTQTTFAVDAVLAF